jgi:hypothetical protein
MKAKEILMEGDVQSSSFLFARRQRSAGAYRCITLEGCDYVEMLYA